MFLTFLNMILSLLSPYKHLFVLELYTLIIILYFLLLSITLKPVDID